ncbi:LolA family protein [Tenuibacillus multivorans]|uniref:Outer membrane lipoprotein-sorting protein n=1 Tax=Tenuibacillus multivorans TaxID=237069 RepID=A0A1H0BA53_9BACI|nr:outer membrane lipoprotein carrier protein LolA [Tenuibacillus multivorans]GEL78768.1 sporulation protein YdcC [Tenuibacillus multivorans]SDN42518.1 Outer membrane lipoprotein-sorting protein [Tenuibacillus multivorans]
MKGKLVLFILLLSMVGLLAACGEDTVDDVVNSLNKKEQDMESFKTTATMEIQTGEEPQQFDVQVWHKKDDYYKVVLQNQLDDKGNQVILRNDEGVFVLTPSINKSYKFQNDWPKHHSQPYLFTSLVSDINNDADREFKVTENYYVFTVKTNYKGNQQLPYQEIYFHKKSLEPALVKVLNSQNEPMVNVDFSDFEFNPEIANTEFDTEENLAEGTVSVPTMAELEEQSMAVYYPDNLPEGAELASEEVVSFENGERSILSFEGDKNFTLVQEMYQSHPTNIEVPVYASGEMVDLGFTVGHLSNNTLEWQQDGMNFVLASDTLTVDEMVVVAKSVQDRAMK